MHTTSPLASRLSGLSLLAKTWTLSAILALAALAAPVANAQPNLLKAGDFEGINSLTAYWPATAGVWGTESSVLSGAGNGITPFGSQMLQVNHAGGGTVSQTNQIVEGPFLAGSVVTFTVKFNTWLAGQSVRLDIQTNAGLALTGVRYSSPTVALDSNTSTWQTVTATTTLASDTNYISAEILLSQNSSGTLYGQPRAYADDAVLTVVPPAQLFFTDSLTGPTSPDLAAIPAGKYGYTASGLQRAQSAGTTDRPMVTTALSSYLTESNFTAEIAVKLASGDLLYFGLGQGDPDPSYFNEPDHAFYFRVHSNWQGNNSIQADVRAGNYLAVNAESVFGYYAAGSTITLRITRAGDSITMSVVGGASVTYSLSASQALGLTNSNTRVFFGNSTVGSRFSDLAIYPTPSDTTPPVIAAPAAITTEATGASGATVTFTATAVDDVDGPVPVQAIPPSGSTFPLGTTVVDLGAADSAGNIAMASFNVTVQDTTPPVITAPADVTAEATSAAGATVTYALPGAEDIVSGSVTVVATQASGSTFPLGATSVGLSATDAAGNAASASFTVTVVDTTAPVISSLTPSTATLWSPNHKMVPITLSAASADAVGVTSLKIVSVTSSEPDNGLGDGDTAGDIQITGDLTVNLRAERSGKGNGRTYTITVEAGDAAGNTSTMTCTVSVPKSQGKK